MTDDAASKAVTENEASQKENTTVVADAKSNSTNVTEPTVTENKIEGLSANVKTTATSPRANNAFVQTKINGHWYLIDVKTGTVQTGFQNIPEQQKRVYYNNQGQMQYGEQHLSNY